MTDQEKDTKQKIIAATIDMIREEGDVKNITIRSIAERAGIGKSMINYYFQSKEHLIDQAVQAYISMIISKGDTDFMGGDGYPEEQLRARFKQAAGFLAYHPGVSRVSILSDLTNGQETDNSSQSLQSIFLQLKKIYGDIKDDFTLKLKAQQLLATLQVIFLRTSVLQKQTGINYYNDLERNKLLDQLIDDVLYDLEGR